MQKLHFYTAHFDFTTAEIVINCTLKYALAVERHVKLVTETPKLFVSRNGFICARLASRRSRQLNANVRVET